jgi:DNA-binding beta-propeller fold protein YncE
MCFGSPRSAVRNSFALVLLILTSCARPDPNRPIAVAGAPSLTSPTGLTVVSEVGHDILYVSDTTAGIKKVDVETGKVTPLISDIAQPGHINGNRENLGVASETAGTVQLLDRTTGRKLMAWADFKSPHEVMILPDGSLLIAEAGAGQLVQLSGTERKIIARLLDEPSGLAPAPGNSAYVSERTAGRVSRFNLTSGERSVIATGLERPEALALTPDGRLYVVEAGVGRISKIDVSTGAKITAAEALPIGTSGGPGHYGGLAASDTALYFTSEKDKAIYRIATQ